MPITIKGDQSAKEMRNKWVYDIRFFKEKCQDKKKDNYETIGSVGEDDPYIIRRKNEILGQRRQMELEKILEKDEEKKEQSLSKTVEKAAKIALQVKKKNNF